VENVLDRKFLSYYLMNYHNVKYEDIANITTYDVKMIDQNVSVKEFDITDKTFITIKENEYTISE
jgi:hypothetical protein